MATKKKKTNTAKLKSALAPKKVVDKSNLVLGTTAAINADNPTKIITRTGVLRVIQKLPDFKVPCDNLAVLNFLMGWGICDPDDGVRDLAVKVVGGVVGYYTTEVSLPSIHFSAFSD